MITINDITDLKTIFDIIYMINMSENQYLKIQEDIQKGEVTIAVQALEKLLYSNQSDQDKIHYLLGNAYRKLNNWQQAMNHYQYAIDINPHSPATTAKAMIIDIMNFYNKDMFNQ